MAKIEKHFFENFLIFLECSYQEQWVNSLLKWLLNLLINSFSYHKWQIRTSEFIIAIFLLDLLVQFIVYCTQNCPISSTNHTQSALFTLYLFYLCPFLFKIGYIRVYSRDQKTSFWYHTFLRDLVKGVVSTGLLMWALSWFV